MNAAFPSPDLLAPIVKANGLAYVVLGRPSLELAASWLDDFGLDHLSGDADHAWFGNAARGSSFYLVQRTRKPGFVGFAVTVAHRDDLQRLVDEGLSEAIGEDLTPARRPCVRLRDPNGFEVHVVVQEAPDDAASVLPPRNLPGRIARIDSPVRDVRAPRVARLGHVVLETLAFHEAVDWYRRTLGVLVTDYQHLPDGRPVVAFCRFDRGDAPTDHHSIAIGQGFHPGLEHLSFELDDVDAVARGHAAMQRGGWRHVWGIGRHIMGSQVFDYWNDPWGAKHEHYADGDLVTRAFPTGRSPFGPQYIAQWGPRMPSTFVGGPLTPRLVWRALRSVLTGAVPLQTLASLVHAAKVGPRDEVAS
ncbi:MAG: VOC family protein [Myxococcota bacterium]